MGIEAKLRDLQRMMEETRKREEEQKKERIRIEMEREKMEEAKKKAAFIPQDNEVDPSPVVDSLRNALAQFLNKDQVKAIVRKELMENTCIHRIELVKEGVGVGLPEVPRHYLFQDILGVVNLNIPVALIGPAGAGKSTLCEQVASALELKFFLQNGVTGAHELTGYLDAHGRYNSTAFRDAFENGGFILVDEVDTSEAGALKWLNTALANGYAAFPDDSDPVRRHPLFRIAIAANTWGTGADRLYVGANQLDASTLDRFVFFNFEYDEKMETLLGGNAVWSSRVQQLRRQAQMAHARIVISPRATINGAKLLKAGWTQEKVEQAVIWKGLDLEIKERILNPKSADNDNKRKAA